MRKPASGKITRLQNMASSRPAQGFTVQVAHVAAVPGVRTRRLPPGRTPAWIGGQARSEFKIAR